MAFEDDLRNFMENRLIAWDPTIDISASSPVQVKVIDPLIARFGEDPFSVDVPTFMRDRLVQEYPELASDDGGLLEDLFSEPFQMLLEPFKRQIELLRINQSAANAELLSDDEADALGANFFQDREEGDYASGLVRLYYSAPTTSRITTDKQLTSTGGLAFWPTENIYITSAQMLFNRDGNQYYVDVPVRASAPGNSYNVGKGEINTIDDVEGVVRVANQTSFGDGLPREDNETYLGNIPQALTERSLVTKRGVTTRLPDTFGNTISAIQVIGAGDDGMDRDILTGTGEGFLHIMADCAFFGSIVIVDSIIYKDLGASGDVVVQVGDTIRLVEDFSVDPDRNVYTATITDFTVVDQGLATEKYILYLNQTITTAAAATYGDAATVAIFKEGYVTISEVPGGVNTSTTVADSTIHLGGHTDVFIRPSEDQEVEGVLSNLTTDEPILALLDVQVWEDDNRVSSGSANFVQNEVEPEDALIIENGTAAGSYKILAVISDTVGRVDGLFAADEVSLRARVARSIKVDLVEPKFPKVPFATSSVSDLNTTVGSTLFRLTSVDIQSLGAVVGDTVRVLDGEGAGDYTIVDFDPVLGGQGPIVNTAAGATETNLRYEVFTLSDGLEFPLVRIKSLEVLDSTNQGTGVAVPYGDAVDIRPKCAFEGAGDSVRVLSKDICILPNTALWGTLGETTVTAGTGKDARYSEEIKYADGIVRACDATGSGSSPIDEYEVNFPPFLWNGRNDSLIVLTSREDTDFDIDTDGDHRTSDVAKGKIGDSLVILDGPNQGSYIIKDLRVMDMWADSVVGHAEVCLVQVNRELVTDAIGDFINYANTLDPGSILATDIATMVELAAERSSFYSDSNFLGVNGKLVAEVWTELDTAGFTITKAQLTEAIQNLATTGYEYGESAMGTARAYFLDPVSVTMNFGDDPTYFRSLEDSSLVYRLDPSLEDAQIFPESYEWTEPTEWYRNMLLKYITVATDKAYAAVNGGSSFASRGIRDDDILQYHPAVNDLLARGDMKSSWLCITQAGSNQIRLIVGRDYNTNGWSTWNLELPEPGHLFFIDSGPDIGAYTITGVSSTNNFTSDPPQDSAGNGLLIQIDQSLTHSTSTYPDTGDADFKSFVPGVIKTSGQGASLVFSGSKQLKLDLQYPGSAWSTVLTYTIPDNTYTPQEFCDLLNQHTTFDDYFTAVIDGNEICIRTLLSQRREQVRIPSCTALDVLEFTTGQYDGGYLGAMAVEGGKRIYGGGLSGASVNTWISVYAARDNEAYPAQTKDILENGDDESYLGTFQVTAAGEETSGPYGPVTTAGVTHTDFSFDYVELDRSDNFSANSEVRWIFHSAPTTTPANTSGGGKELSTNYVRFRMYSEVAEERTVEIPWSSTPNPIDSDSSEQIEVDPDFITAYSYSHMMPYRILRGDILRASSTFMSTQRSGALYYIDLPLVGLGVREELNISKTSSLEMYGNYSVAGYTLEVEKPIFTFSTQEQSSIILPRHVLPVGSTPDSDNELTLAGQSIQVNYDNSPLVESVQQFMTSPLDRIIVANILVRHFLPSYVIIDAVYVGGDLESAVAQQIIDHINSIDPDVNELAADDIAEIIRKRNASQVRMPLNLIALTHGTDRKIRGVQSEDLIGGDSLPTFTGNYSQTYFIAGPDTSSEDPRPSGEQVFLVRV